MSTRELGVKNFRRRLAVAIRDSVLRAISNPEDLARDKGLPLFELGPLADLKDDQRTALAQTIAYSVDAGISHFLYGLDEQPDGFELTYQRERLNVEGMRYLNADDAHISDESRFNEFGAPRK